VVDLCADLRHFAVDADFSGGDAFLDAAAGAQARVGQHLVQAFGDLGHAGGVAAQGQDFALRGHGRGCSVARRVFVAGMADAVVICVVFLICIVVILVLAVGVEVVRVVKFFVIVVIVPVVLEVVILEVVILEVVILEVVILEVVIL